jgi:hypothetical protein
MALAIALSALLFAPLALAEQTPAQKELNDGDKAASANQWEEALGHFKKSHEMSPTAGSSRRVANALYKLNRVVEAHDAYEALLKDYGKSLLPPDKKTAEDRRTELKGKIGTITVQVSETGAAIAVDGADVGISPLPTPVRVVAGSHTVKVSKPGFDPFEQTLSVPGKGGLTVSANLQEVKTGGRLVVNVEGGEKLKVVIDGVEAGEAPYDGPIAEGPHKISGRSATLSAPEVSVEIKRGETSTVTLVPIRGGGTLDVRVEGIKADILVDGKKVGTGSWKGVLSEGEHELRVTAKGYDPYVKKVKIVSGEIVAEAVELHKETAGNVKEKIKTPWTFNGLYGGLQFIGMFEPTGSGNTLDNSCEVTGATTCDGGTPMGGGVGGYIGYAFAPVGLELQILGAADVNEPLASFDGVSGSEVNPLVAQPPREEEFIMARFGGGGAIRLRLLMPLSRFRITGAIGAGLAYREMLLGRDATAQNGATSDIAPDGNGYLSGVLSIELGAQVLLGGTTSLALGFNMWLEHAGDGVATEADNSVFLTKEGEIPQPHATPAYDMASGTQLFIGPFLGLHFGPDSGD